ncbi:MAG: hypothetical protein CXZ00_16790, partial [Acidobacteria bacterium]
LLLCTNWMLYSQCVGTNEQTDNRGRLCRYAWLDSKRDEYAGFHLAVCVKRTFVLVYEFQRDANG